MSYPKPLAGQIGRVRDALDDGEWHTLAELAAVAGAPEASVSTRLRDLRLPQYGGHTIENRRRPDGLFEYRLHGTLLPISDLGREYLAAGRACRKYQAAAEACRTAVSFMEAAGAPLSRIEDVQAAADAMWAERERLYGIAYDLGRRTTAADLADQPPAEPAADGTMEP